MTNSNGNSRTLTAVRPDIFQIFLLDEDGQNILSIDDGALRQSLRIEIVNTSGRNIAFQALGDRASLNNYHFCISFRPGTLLKSQDKEITLKETGEGWEMQQKDNDNTFYLLSTTQVINSGERITLTLENIGAAPEGGSRGTRVEIKYNNLKYEGSNEVISGNRLQYLNIVNQRGKKQIPLYVGFLGSNTILNDGTENELTLTIQSLPNQNSQLRILKTPEIQIIKDDTTRWEGDLVKFIQEKIPNFNSKIEEIEEDPESEISNNTKRFFGLLRESVDLNDSFEDFKSKLINLMLGGDLILDRTHKEEIFKILIQNLGVIIEDDLNAILTQLKELLYTKKLEKDEQERIRQIILQIIQESKNFKVIKSELNPNGLLEFKGLDEQGLLDRAAKFTISFDVTTTDDNDSKNWALVEKTDADDIQIEIVKGQENWIFGGKEEQGITPRWSFICKKGLQLQDRTEILRFSISNLKTQLLSGYANLYVHYENIPGYWDGYISVPIHKGPLVYRENSSGVGCVGIGTDRPQGKLHVKSANGVDGLKVEGNTAIAGNLSVTNGQVAIGTNDSGSDRLKIQGNTAIAGNLSVTNGRVAIGSSDFSREPLVIRAQGREEGLIAFEDPNGNKKWHIEQNYAGNTPGLNFVETDVKVFRFFIQRGGNVGIGTGDPAGKLDVHGDIYKNGTKTIALVGISQEFNNQSSSSTWFKNMSYGITTNTYVEVSARAYSNQYKWGNSRIRFYYK